jgi:hypothetical protein
LEFILWVLKVTDRDKVHFILAVPKIQAEEKKNKPKNLADMWIQGVDRGVNKPQSFNELSFYFYVQTNQQKYRTKQDPTFHQH